LPFNQRQTTREHTTMPDTSWYAIPRRNYLLLWRWSWHDDLDVPTWRFWRDTCIPKM